MILAGEGVINCGCDLMHSNASWDMKQGVRPWHKYHKNFLHMVHMYICYSLTIDYLI